MKRSQQGFTLVELAIVLVIIGLIVGGVLVGQDLIKAATLQKGVSSLEDTQAAATTFRTKYNALPGDFNGTQAIATFTTANGFPLAITNLSASIVGMGDGNGLVEAVTSTAGGAIATDLGSSGETLAFYPELYNAGYIKQAMSHSAMNATPGTYSNAFLVFPTPGTNKPLVVVQALGGRNYLSIVGTPTTGAVVPNSWTAALTPADANNIDSKIDDGIPATGGVLAIGSSAGAGTLRPGTAGTAGTATTSTCFYGATTSAAYNVGQSSQLCSLSLRASF